LYSHPVLFEDSCQVSSLNKCIDYKISLCFQEAVKNYDNEDDDDQASDGHQKSSDDVEIEYPGQGGYAAPPADYEPVARRGSRSKSRGHDHEDDHSDEDEHDDDDDDDHHEHKPKKKIKPKVIIVKKLIPLSTTTSNVSFNMIG